MKFKDTVIHFATTHYILTLCILALISVCTGYFYVQIKLDNSVQSFYFQDDPILLQYNEFREKVGSDELVIVGFMEKNLFSNENIELIRKLTAALKNIAGVKRVHSLTTLDQAVIDHDEISMKKMIPDGTLSKDQLLSIKEKINSMKGYNRLTSETRNGTAAIIIVELAPYNTEQRLKMADDIVHTTENITDHRVRLYHSGIPIVFAEMDKMTKRDLRTMMPFVGLLVFLITILLFKNFTLTALAWATLGITMVWTVGLFVMVGEKANFIISILPAVLMALAIADAVHLISHFIDETKKGLHGYIDTVVISSKEVWMPCLFTTLTTAVGFFSFVTSPLRPVFILGIFATLGVLLAFMIDMTLLPAALVLFRERMTNWLEKKRIHQTGDEHNRLLAKLVGKIGYFSTTHMTGLLVIFVMIIILSITGMSKLRFESNPLKHLSDDNKIKSDLLFLEDNFGGFIPHMAVLTAKGDHDFTDPRMIQIAEMFEKEVRENYPEVVSDSFSIADYVKELNKIFNKNDDAFYRIPDNPLDIMDYYEMGIYPEFMKRLISRDRRETYITFMGKAGSGTVEEWQAMKTHEMKVALDILGKNFGDVVSIAETGMSELLIQMEENLKTSQIRSIVITFFLILVMMMLMCKNVKLALIGMIPNVFPIMTTLGIMGWLDIPLNETTVMIAAVTLGIAVDDTVHFLTWFMRYSGPGVSIKEALLKTHKIVGKPIIITTLLLSLSFSVLLMGSFKPVQTYGILTSFSLIVALIADLFFLPALILLFKPQTAKKTVVGKKQGTHRLSSSQTETEGYAASVTIHDN